MARTRFADGRFFGVPVRRILLVGSVGLLAGIVFRDAWREARKPSTRLPTLDARLAPLVAAAAGERRIGFIAHHDDGRQNVAAGLAELQYALAPVVVASGAKAARLVGVWIESPERLDELASREGWRILVRTSKGYAIVERTRP